MTPNLAIDPSCTNGEPARLGDPKRGTRVLGMGFGTTCYAAPWNLGHVVDWRLTHVWKSKRQNVAEVACGRTIKQQTAQRGLRGASPRGLPSGATELQKAVCGGEHHRESEAKGAP